MMNKRPCVILVADSNMAATFRGYFKRERWHLSLGCAPFEINTDVGADLLVVGKRRSTAFEDFFFGCTARRVLGHAKCDVLIVPHGFQPSTRGTAKMRARTVPAVGSNTLGCTRGKVS